MKYDNVEQINELMELIKKVPDENEQIYKLVNQITEERKKQKISKVELSKITGINRSTIFRIETFSTIPTLNILIKILDVLNMKIVIQPK